MCPSPGAKIRRAVGIFAANHLPCVDNHAAPFDSRQLVFKEVTVVGILSASPGLRESIRYIAEGKIDVLKILGGTVGMSEAGDIFLGNRPAGMGVGPKVLINPRG